MSSPTDKFLDAATAVLARDRSASMQQIAAAAGTSRTTLSRHFPTREALLEKLVERVLNETRLVLDQAALETAPVQEAFTVLTEHFQAIGKVWGIGYGFGYSAHHLVSTIPGMYEQVVEIDARITRFIERGQKEGFFRQDLPAQWLSGVFQGLAETTSELIADQSMGGRQGPSFLSTFFLQGAKP